MNIFLWGLGVALHQGAPVMNLEEALRIAEANAFRVRIASSDVERSRQKLAEAKGLLGPSIAAQARYTRFDKEITASFGSSTVVIRPADQKEASLSLNMPVDISRNLGRTVDAARYSLKATEATYSAERNALRLEVREGYFKVTQAGWQVKVAEQSLDNAKKRLENAELRQKAGELAMVDVLRFRTEVAQREAELITATNSLSLAKNALNNTLGRPIQTEFTTEEIGGLPGLPQNADAVVAQALRMRPELDALRNQTEAFKKIRESEERGMEPTMNLSIVHGRNIGAQGLGAAPGTTSGVITLGLPLYDSGVTRSRVRAARQDEEQAKIRLEQRELGVSLEVRQSLKELENALARLAVADRQVAFAAETYRLSVLKYETQEGIQLEVIDAQTQLTAAQTAQVAARYDVWVAYSQLQAAVGKDQIAVEARDSSTVLKGGN